MILFGPAARARRCGDCTLCCKLLPVKGIDKPANQRCQHQRHHKGCAVYHQPRKGFPSECGMWSCAWLMGEAGDTTRPDRAGYVIDPMPDYIEVHDHTAGTDQKILVLQVWVEPNRPDAHRDPALRRFLEEGQHVAIIRSSDIDGFILSPPSTNNRGIWYEHHTAVRGGHHTVDQVFDVLTGVA